MVVLNERPQSVNTHDAFGGGAAHLPFTVAFIEGGPHRSAQEIVAGTHSDPPRFEATLLRISVHVVHDSHRFCIRCAVHAITSPGVLILSTEIQ